MISEQLRQSLLGDWISIATEVRPGSTRNPDGTPQPLYLTRNFSYSPEDRFSLDITTYADSYGKVALAKIALKGHMQWGGDHPVASGAQKVDFYADEAYEVTPLVQGFADVLNRVAAHSYEKWQVGQAQSVFGKSFALFNLVEGKHFMEHDLIYVANGLLFWGARHVDGRGFDTEQNRPTNLQIPLTRK
jgi:hypothetical protein